MHWELTMLATGTGALVTARHCGHQTMTTCGNDSHSQVYPLNYLQYLLLSPHYNSIDVRFKLVAVNFIFPIHWVHLQSCFNPLLCGIIKDWGIVKLISDTMSCVSCVTWPVWLIHTPGSQWPVTRVSGCPAISSQQLPFLEFCWHDKASTNRTV